MKNNQIIPAYRHFTALAVIATEAAKAVIPYAPVRGQKLYEKLIRIEKQLHRIAEAQCNGGMTEQEEDRLDAIWEKQREKVLLLIDPKYRPFLHLNGDPRGYTLKLDINRIEKQTSDIYNELQEMHQDFGGYFILAPDF